MFLAAGSAYGLGGAIASEEPLASYMGARILERGGNAADAAVAISLSLSVLIPHLGGIGGDLFAIVGSPNGRMVALNGSGRSPRRLSLELISSAGLHRLPDRGPLTITVPGMIGALHELWRRFGSLEWRDLVRPIASMAKGFPAPPSLARAVNKYYDVISLDEGSSATYANVRSWQKFSLPGLSRALEIISEDPLSFYSGEIAERIVEYVEKKGGVLEVGDMKRYEPTWEEPLRSSYREWIVYETPPNSQGITTLHLLRLLEELPRPAEPEGSLRLIASLAPPCYAWRDENVGDPEYMSLRREELLSERVIESIKMMSSQKSGAQSTGDTTFFAVIDGSGMMVAIIQSLFYPFGSGITEPTYQITLNNRALGFSMRKGVPNSLGPSKRPLHTLSILALLHRDEERAVLIGASGGHHRPQQHAIFASYIVDHGMSIEEAVNSPRMVWDYATGKILAERGLSVEGATVTEAIGVANAVELRGSIKGASTDRRGDGAPLAIP